MRDDVFSRIINLKTRPDRWALLSGLGVPRFEAVAPESNYEASTHLSLRAKAEFQAGRRTTEGIPSKGAIGCSLSHILIWRLFLTTDKPYCLVLEDDVKVNKAALEAEVGSILKTDFDVGMIGYSVPLGLPLSRRPDNSIITWPQGQCFYGSHAYVLTRRGAEILLKDALPIQMQIDFYIQAVSTFSKLRVYSGQTRIRQNKDFISDIEDRFCLTCEPIWIKLGFTVLLCLIVILILTRHRT